MNPGAQPLDILAVGSAFAVSTGVASLALTRAVHRFAVRHAVLDHPNTRSAHTVPTPRGGGLAIIAASELGLGVAKWSDVVASREAVVLGAGLLMIGAIGWLDDRGGIAARYRLSVHAIVAGWAAYMLGGLPVLHLGTSAVALGPAGWVLATIGIVWSINLFNFMDGIDGLAGSQALLIFGAAAVLFAICGDAPLASVAAILMGATAGFLPQNWPPAKIFMGDVGSGAIGFAIAVLAIASESRGSVPLLVFAILGGVFVADATVTLIRRVSRGHRAADAHNDHAYQRLARAWGSHRRVTLLAAGVTIGLIVLGVAATVEQRALWVATIIAYGLLGALLVAAERRTPM